MDTSVKIDPTVKQFFRNHPEGRMRVLTVLSAECAKSAPLGESATPFSDMLESDFIQSDESSIKRVERALVRSGAKDVRWLAGAASFAADVTEAQLSDVARLSEVKEGVSDATLSRI